MNQLLCDICNRQIGTGDRPVENYISMSCSVRTMKTGDATKDVVETQKVLQLDVCAEHAKLLELGDDQDAGGVLDLHANVARSFRQCVGARIREIEHAQEMQKLAAQEAKNLPRHAGGIPQGESVPIGRDKSKARMGFETQSTS